jgi:acyl-CoA synthetase (AMP-forming)/AMP-acid ligase II
VTTLEGSPVIAAALAREAARRRLTLPTIRGVYSGGAPVLPSLHEALLPWLPNGDSVVVYGSTEAEPISAASGKREVLATAAASAGGHGLCVGRPVASVAVRIVDDELLVAGAHVNEGYFEDPEAAARFKVRGPDGRIWHRTGDAARQDADGRLWLLGRHEHRLAVDGGWLYPTAVEVAARLRPGVAQAAVLDHGGVTLVVEPSPGGVAPDLSALRALHPALTRVVTQRSIPTDPRHNAKIDYAALRKALG